MLTFDNNFAKEHNFVLAYKVRAALHDVQVIFIAARHHHTLHVAVPDNTPRVGVLVQEDRHSVDTDGRPNRRNTVVSL